MVETEKAVQSERVSRSINTQFSWFVGRALSFVDITIDDPVDTKDRHSKKGVLKKLFEKDIYALRDQLLHMTDNEVRSNLDPLFKKMVKGLVDYSLASIPDKLRRYTFNELLAGAVNEALEKIQNDIA